MTLKLALSIVALVIASTNFARADNLAKQAFADLSLLIGQWEGSAEGGQAHRVNFELTANDTVLVETWTMSPTRKSMTVYAIDGDRLLATHYCPQGNQPRLVLTGKDRDGKYRFEFLDGTNLQDPDGAHQHSLWLNIASEQSFSRAETYVSNGASDRAGAAEGEAVSYARVPD